MYCITNIRRYIFLMSQSNIWINANNENTLTMNNK